MPDMKKVFAPSGSEEQARKKAKETIRRELDELGRVLEVLVDYALDEGNDSLAELASSSRSWEAQTEDLRKAAAEAFEEIERARPPEPEDDDAEDL